MMPGPRCWRTCWGGWPSAFPGGRPASAAAGVLHGLLMELDDHNCWMIAEAAGHRGPHRLQHLLSRAVQDDQQVLDIASAWAVGHRDDGDAVLIVDETADEKSSAECAGTARQYSGTAGGVALCQVAVMLAFAASRGHALIGRALYLPEGCAADEEHRELAGVPGEVLVAAKPQLADDLLDRADGRGIRAVVVVGDEVCGGCLPNPAEFGAAAEQAASAWAASGISAHTADKIISIITVQAGDRPAAVAIALAVISEALTLLVHAGLGWRGAPDVEKCS